MPFRQNAKCTVGSARDRVPGLYEVRAGTCRPVPLFAGLRGRASARRAFGLLFQERRNILSKPLELTGSRRSLSKPEPVCSFWAVGVLCSVITRPALSARFALAVRLCGCVQPRICSFKIRGLLLAFLLRKLNNFVKKSPNFFVKPELVCSLTFKGVWPFTAF